MAALLHHVATALYFCLVANRALGHEILLAAGMSVLKFLMLLAALGAFISLG